MYNTHETGGGTTSFYNVAGSATTESRRLRQTSADSCVDAR